MPDIVPDDLTAWQRRAEQGLRAIQADRAVASTAQVPPSRVESTVLGCLAALATSPQPACPDTLEQFSARARWLGELQQADGGVWSDEKRGSADCRPTAWAALLWKQLPDRRRCLARAIRFLLEQEACAPPSCDDQIVDRGAAIGGWPWFDLAGDWTTATAVTLLVLGQNQLAGHARVADSLAWIASQALPDGGWSAPAGAVARAGPIADVKATGMLLLALRAARLAETPLVSRACEFLAHRLPQETAPERLGWGLLGWSCWRAWPSEASEWLARAFVTTPSVLDAEEPLALLLLAAASDACRALLGIAEVPTGIEWWPPLVGV